MFLTAAAAAVAPLLSQAPPAASETVTLRILVAPTADAAQRLLERIKRGENFIALAVAESIDPSAPQGGLIGTVSVASLRPELRDALRGVGPGQLTPIVQIPTGFAILRVSEANEPVAAASPAAALSATGSVKYLTQIGGFSEAEEVLRGFPKAEDWNTDLKTICQARRESLANAHRRMEAFLSPPAGSAPQPPLTVGDTHFALAQFHAFDGRMAEAIEHYTKALELARVHAPAAVPGIELALGSAYLHKAGIDNAVFRKPGDMCLIPPRPGAQYPKTADSERAIAHFLEYLRLRPGELAVRWLLNLAFMTTGGYPERVPKTEVIPPHAFASGEDVGRFRDVAPEAGLDVFATAGGVVVDDLSGTGRFDIVASNFDHCTALNYMSNTGAGTFTRRTEAAGLDAQLGGLNLMQTDYNNDGCKDLLVLRGGWQLPQRKSLLRNNCDGTFTDVTVESGLAKPTSTQSAAWADIDNDGFLDLFVANEDSAAQLFLNRRNGTFEDIAGAAGVNRVAFSKGVTAADYDNDGFTDFHVSNLGAEPFLYRNNRNRTFTDIASAAGVRLPAQGFATWFFDYDNDGWQDLFAASYFRSLDEIARTYLRLPSNATPLQLHRNLGDGTFRNVTAEVGLDKVFMPMGSNFGDIDNDGFLDIYLGNGEPSYASLVPYVLLRNRNGKSFVDVTASSGTGELHKGHGVAFADLDFDGDQDIVVEVGGVTPGDGHAMRLFENPGHGNDWISVKLVGMKTNRAAIGARIKVTVETAGSGTRSIYRTVSSGGSFGASPLDQHIGLGKAARIVELEVSWPASGTRQRFARLAANQAIEIAELADDYKQIKRVTVPLGGTRRAQ